MSATASFRDRGPALRGPWGGAEVGFTYLGILLVVAFVGIGLAAVGQLWSIGARRADEEQLLYVGDSYRRAIGSYYRSGRQFPRSLDELVLDKRVNPPAHHLRRLYPDPITRQADWRLVTLDDGSIVGVASQSTRKPLKVANFPVADSRFEDASCYCDWEFVFLPTRAANRQRRLPGAEPAPLR